MNDGVGPPPFGKGIENDPPFLGNHVVKTVRGLKRIK